MSAAENERELTSTLHLGLRSVGTGNESAPLETFLSHATEEERTTVSAVISGSADKAMIIIHRGPNKGSRFLIEDEEVSIGRSPESSIFLDDVTVSRKHCVIRRVKPGVFELHDKGSLNGTYINDASTASAQLKTGDEIQVGKFHAIFITASSPGEK